MSKEVYSVKYFGRIAYAVQECKYLRSLNIRKENEVFSDFLACFSLYPRISIWYIVPGKVFREKHPFSAVNLKQAHMENSVTDFLLLRKRENGT